MGQKATKAGFNKKTKVNFHDYARRNAIENEYSFWLEASEFQRRRWDSDNEMKACAEAIFKKFIEDGGPCEVCIGLREKNGIIRELKNPSYKIFQEALLAMSALLMHHLVNFKRLNGIDEDDEVSHFTPTHSGTATPHTTGPDRADPAVDDEGHGNDAAPPKRKKKSPQPVRSFSVKDIFRPRMHASPQPSPVKQTSLQRQSSHKGTANIARK